MRIERLRNKMIVRNKVTGKNYVLAITKTPSGIGAINAFPLGEDGEVDDEAPGIEITESNAICFRIIADPEPKEIPNVKDYEVVEGIVKNKTTGAALCDQGAIVVSEILGATRGCMILLCEEDGTKVIKNYNLIRDRFTDMLVFDAGENVSSSYQVFVNETMAVINYSSEMLEDRTLEDGTKEARRIFCNSDINVYIDGDLEYTTEESQPLEQYATLELQNGDIAIVYTAMQRVSEDGEVSDYDIHEKVPSKTLIFHNGKIRSRILKDYPVERITKSYTETTDFAYAMFGSGIIDLGFDKFENPVVNQMPDNLSYVVDYTRKDEVTILTLSNADASEVKKVIRTETKDRGVVYTIE